MHTFSRVQTLVSLFLMPVGVCAAEYEYTEETSDELYPEDEMDGLMNSLPEDVRGEIEAFISAQNDSERYESLKDKLEISYWLSFISEKDFTLYPLKLWPRTKPSEAKTSDTFIP